MREKMEINLPQLDELIIAIGDLNKELIEIKNLLKGEEVKMGDEETVVEEKPKEGEEKKKEEGSEEKKDESSEESSEEKKEE